MDVMVLAHEDDSDTWQAYWYARIIGIFHILVRHVGEQSTSTETWQVDFLYVHWFGQHTSSPTNCWSSKRLPHLGFLDSGDEDAYTFLDPQEVI